MHETDKFSALLSNENVGQMMCFINPSLDYIRVGDQLFAIDDSGPCGSVRYFNNRGFTTLLNTFFLLFIIVTPQRFYIRF